MSSPEAHTSSAPKLYRISTLKDFLPLSAADNSSLSARGQTLPGLIQSHSSSNIAGLRNRTDWRSKSVYGSSVDDKARRNFENDNPKQQHAEVEAGYRGYGPDDRRMSMGASVLATPQMRSQRLIGNSNPRYKWERYWKSDDELAKMKKPIRKYYERNNYLIQHYLYIDRLLDSSLPHNLIQEYHHPGADGSDPVDVPSTIVEEPSPFGSPKENGHPTTSRNTSNGNLAQNGTVSKVKRTPKDIYRLQATEDTDENSPLLKKTDTNGDEEAQLMPPDLEMEEETGSQSRTVAIAIYLNLAANTVLLITKIIVVALSSSISVLASLVDAALDFLSTAIVWTTTRLIAHNDQYSYPIGRRRLEPVGVLVFSVIMITSFVQVALEGLSKLKGDDHSIVALTAPAIAIMAGTVVIKAGCWLWCRMIKNSSVQALAQDAITDVVFNTFSIIFPLIGYYASIWWLDPLGGVLLSVYVIAQWAQTSTTHIRNLTGCAASADERNVLLYLTMRFAKTVKQIQGLQAYHSGDKLNVEVDVVLDEGTSLRDSHDLGESLQYVLESVPNGQSPLPLILAVALHAATPPLPPWRHWCARFSDTYLCVLILVHQLIAHSCISTMQAGTCLVTCSKITRGLRPYV